MKRLISAIIVRWRKWEQHEPSARAVFVWDRLATLENMGEPVYVAAFANQLGYLLWKHRREAPNITPARFVESAKYLLDEKQVPGAGYILDLTPDMREAIWRRTLPMLAGVAGGRRFQSHVEQLLHKSANA